MTDIDFSKYNMKYKLTELKEPLVVKKGEEITIDVEGFSLDDIDKMALPISKKGFTIEVESGGIINIENGVEGEWEMLEKPNQWLPSA